MSENKKINVLVIPSDRHGVGFYRSISPHMKLQELYPNEFEVTIEYEPKWPDIHSFDKYDIIHIHKGLYHNMESFWSALRYFKEHNIVTILDLDDNWNIGPQHPLYLTNKSNETSFKIQKNLSLVDYATTTTSIFADKIRKENKNVFVFPNAIDPNDPQYSPVKNESKRIRFGFVMGSSHERDMEQFQGVIGSLKKETLDKIQIVLCGFDLRGTITMVGKNGEIVGTRPIKPLESVWYKYEKNVTDDYKILSPEYRDYLLGFKQEQQWANVDNEPYRREWTKDITEFATHYKNVDVLLAPLDENDFNVVKSELKFIEAGFTNTAIVCSNFGPYTLGSKGLFQYGGGIDKEANCVLIEPRKATKMWVKAIEKLANEPELIKTLADNLHNHVKDTYDIKNVTANRAEFYKKIIKK